MHLDAVDLKDFYACPLGLVVRKLLGAAPQGALGRPQILPHLRARLRHPLSRPIQERGRASGRADAGAPRRRSLAAEGPVLERAGRRDRAAADRRGRRPHPAGAHARMVGESARAVARAVARAGAERTLAADRAPIAAGYGRGSTPRRSAMAARSAAASSRACSRTPCSRRRNGTTRSTCRPSAGAFCSNGRGSGNAWAWCCGRPSPA